LKGHNCAVASWKGERHPTCAVWATQACSEIEAALDAGARSLHGAISHLGGVDVDFSAVRGGPGGDPFFNINSQRDMATAQAWLIGRREYL